MCPRLPLELLLVCRRVHDEALDMLLQANHFVLRARPSHPEMLTPLAAGLPVAHLARMTRLTIRLNSWLCPLGHDKTQKDYLAYQRASHNRTCGVCGTNVGDVDPVLSSSCPNSIQMLEVWEQACCRLGTQRQLVVPNLNLTLICDVDPSHYGDVASLLVDPLQRYLPTLKACTLRLGRSSTESHLTRLARDTALGLTQDQERERAEPFPFARLPWEIKLQVMLSTHLGPAGTGGYDPRFERLHLFNGQLIKGIAKHEPIWLVEKCCGACTGTFLDW